MDLSLSPPTCRAARGWLGWTQAQLAIAAEVGLSTVRNFEAGEPEKMPREAKVKKIQKALDAAGVPFIHVLGKDGLFLPHRGPDGSVG